MLRQERHQVRVTKKWGSRDSSILLLVDPTGLTKSPRQNPPEAISFRRRVFLVYIYMFLAARL